MSRPPCRRRRLLLVCLAPLLVLLAPEATALNEVLYLKGDGVPSASLSNTAPTAGTLPNYDPGRDGEPGLLLAKSGEGLSETDPTKHQVWVTAKGSQVFSGPTTFTFWSAMKDFNTGKRGIVIAGLYNCNRNRVNCQLITQAQLDLADWSGGSSTWVERTIDFGIVNFEVPGGRSILLKVVVGNDSDDDMWFAYDTTAYPSRLEGTPGSEITLLKSVSAASAVPGDTLVYTLVHTNAGTGDLFPQQTVDPVPADTDFQVGSTTFTPGTSGVTAVIDYSDDGGTSWGYSPVSGGGGAPAGFDRNVTHVRYTFNGTLSSIAPDNTYTVGFAVRVR